MDAGLTDGPNVLSIYEMSSVTGKTVRKFLGLKGRFSVVSMSANGKRVAYVAPNGLTEVWDIERGARLVTVALPTPPQRRLPGGVIEFPPKITGVRLSQNGKLLFCLEDGRPRLFNIDAGRWGPDLKWDTPLQPATYAINGFSRDGRFFLYNGVYAKSVREPEAEVLAVWDTATGRLLKSWITVPRRHSARRARCWPCWNRTARPHGSRCGTSGRKGSKAVAALTPPPDGRPEASLPPSHGRTAAGFGG